MVKDLQTRYGLPLVGVDNIWEVVESSGIANWKTVAEPIAVEDYPEANLTVKEMEIKRKLQMEVSQFLNPRGEIFKGFCLSGGSGTRIFTLLEDKFVPICVEFQHGCGEVLFDLPGGWLELGEDPAVCAKREFEEESGIILKNVISLSSVGMPIAARRLRSRNFSFLGIANKPVEIKSQKLDFNEHIKIILVSLDDWLKLIDLEIVQTYSASTTLLALKRLNILEIKR